MSKTATKIDKTLLLRPSAAPVSPELNELWHDSATSKLKKWNGSAWEEVIFGSATQDLSNKTLSFLRQSVASDSTTTGSATTLAAFTTGIVRLTNISLVSLSGIPAGLNGQSLIIENKTGVDVNILNDDAGASAANRILTGTGSQIRLASNSTFIFTYDSVGARWMLTGGAGVGGIASSANINNGVTSIVVTLPQVMLDTSYIVTAIMTNLTDSSPQFQPVVITAKTTTTFTATWNSPTDSANYILAYTTSGVATSSTLNGRVSLLADLVVGSSADVTSGFADYSSLQSAINAASAGQKIRIKSNITIAENITINKRVTIEGNGYGSYISGSVTVVAIDYCTIKDFRCNSLTLDSSSDGNNVYGMFFGAAPIDNGIGNSVNGVIV